MVGTTDRLLRDSLLANGVFSATCGAVSWLGAVPLTHLLGVPAPEILTALGVQLVVFAGLLFLLATRPVISPRLALSVVAADAAWVAGTVPLLLSGLLTPLGAWTALLIGLAVGLLAVLQFVGVRRVRPGSGVVVA